jgi:DNA repair exonuclease SbcCD nuclease subunit
LFYTTTTREYLDWFVNLVKSDPTIDSIGFLGDWHESRSNLHIDTMNLSKELVGKLDALGLPIFFVVGNHDLFNRQSRDIHSCVFFDLFPNVQVIQQPTIMDQFDGKALFSPYLFHTEYDFCLTKQPVQHLLGHFEFKDFVITGYSVKMEHGPDAKQLTEYKNILSGHFHKRQKSGNVSYIGNTFCTSFADANDVERGAAIYEFDKAKITYHNWTNGPQYIKTTLSDLSAGRVEGVLNEKTFVRCIADTAITFEEHRMLKDSFLKEYGVKSAEIIEDKRVARAALTETLSEVDQADLAKMTVDELVEKMLVEVAVENIDGKTLAEIYKTLKLEK